MTTPDDRELAYYRAVEDLFAALRGVPHLLSPKDFQLLRTWWREEIPLDAVRAGISQAFARRRERGEPTSVLSLTYCRHAVREQALRLAQMRVGSEQPEDSATSGRRRAALADIALRLRRAAVEESESCPRVAATLEAFANQVDAVGDLPEAAWDEQLFSLETSLLPACLDALPGQVREEIQNHAEQEAAASGATGEPLTRTVLALRDRELRRRLGLPRLEL